MLKMFIKYSLNSIQFLFRCSYFNRSWPAVSRDGRFLIAFTASCIVNGSVDGSNWLNFFWPQSFWTCEFALEFGFAFALKIFL